MSGLENSVELRAGARQEWSPKVEVLHFAVPVDGESTDPIVGSLAPGLNTRVISLVSETMEFSSRVGHLVGMGVRMCLGYATMGVLGQT